jgi:hypothetical protein
MLPEPPATPPVYTAPILFGTRRRIPRPPAPGVAALSGIRAVAGVQPCPTLRALLARRGGDQP